MYSMGSVLYLECPLSEVPLYIRSHTYTGHIHTLSLPPLLPFHSISAPSITISLSPSLPPFSQPPSQPQGGQPANWSGAMHAGHFPLQPTMIQQQVTHTTHTHSISSPFSPSVPSYPDIYPSSSLPLLLPLSLPLLPPLLPPPCLPPSSPPSLPPPSLLAGSNQWDSHAHNKTYSEMHSHLYSDWSTQPINDVITRLNWDPTPHKITHAHKINNYCKVVLHV